MKWFLSGDLITSLLTAWYRQQGSVPLSLFRAKPTIRRGGHDALRKIRQHRYGGLINRSGHMGNRRRQLGRQFRGYSTGRDPFRSGKRHQLDWHRSCQQRGVWESYVGKVISSMGIRKELYLVTKCGTEFIDVKWFAMSKNKYYNSKDEASKML